MFVGRQHELSLLKRAIASERAELVVVYGRRRVGKSSLLARLVSGRGDLHFEALQGVSQKQQIEHFLWQLAEQTGTPRAAARDWREAFRALTFHIAAGRHYVVFDEFPWMASGRTHLVSLLKYFWDNQWKENAGLTLVLCGSVASFMLQHIVHSRALHNRKTLEIKLPPLVAFESQEFFKGLRSSHEVARFLMVFGGIPKYLEQVDPTRSLADNLDRLCFQKHGFFLNEFDTIFKEQFKVTRSYERIVRSLAQQSGSKEDLSRRTGIRSGGGLTGYLNTLEQAEFVKTFVPVPILGKRRKTRRIVLWDEWLRFYFTWMEPNLQVIEMNTEPGLLGRLAGGGLDSYFGLAFERLCMKNLPRLFQHLGIDFHQVRGFGPFFRQPARSGASRAGFQIDILVHRTGDVLTLIECKLSARTVGASVIEEVRKKVSLLRAPARYTVERVLVCSGDVSPRLQNSGYFHQIAGIEALF